MWMWITPATTKFSNWSHDNPLIITQINLRLIHPCSVEEDVDVEAGDVVTEHDVRVDLADLGEEEPEEGALRVHPLDLGAALRLGRQRLLEVERPHLVLNEVEQGEMIMS